MNRLLYNVDTTHMDGMLDRRGFPSSSYTQLHPVLVAEL